MIAFLTALNQKECSANHESLGGLIDLKIRKIDNIDVEVFIRICQTQEELDLLVKETKQYKDTLINVYTSFD